MSIIESVIGKQKEQYQKLTRLLGYIFCVTIFSGFVLEISFSKIPPAIFYIDYINMSLSVIAFILFYLKRISLCTVFELQILGLLMNMLISHFITPVDSPDFAPIFLRNAITMGMLVPVYGIFCDKKNILHIAVVYIILHISSLIRGHNEFLMRNAPFLMINGIIYFISVYFIMDLMEKMRDRQVKLYDNLKQRNNLFISINNDLNQKNRQIDQQSKKLKELGDTKDILFSVIAHDLRSPFNSIIGFSELLLNDKVATESGKSEEFISLINTTAKHTLSLLENLLSWTKIQSGQIDFNPKKLKLKSVVTDIIDVLVSSALIKGISIDYIESDEIEVSADADMLQTILRNLIQNSIKFTNPGGKITIRTFSKENQIDIIVEDNGTGMDEEVRKKLFSKNFNLSTEGTDKEKGSGLGLILCREFVKAHGGEIRAESEINKGSRFIVTLPR